ncbi:MAG TPA: ABC transporter ATP-binding protein/permease [Clostridiaceae bacterium]|nr:ABC transporter ATP-binding protein/permease [Clostridiaceae bacterium]
MEYSGKYKIFTYLSLILSGASSILALIPFVYIWKIIKEVIEVMPNFQNATNIVHNGWMAVAFSIISMVIYFIGLICSHMSAFRVAANMRKKAMEHITKMPIGKIDEIGSGRLRKIVNESAGGTETYLAHQLPDMAGALVTPICMLIFLFIFDWKLGLVSLIPTIIGFLAMLKMMGKQMAEDIGKYQNSLEVMNNEAVEYVRGMPVVKSFGQSVYTFKKFKKSIEDYDNFCMAYTKKARKPMIEFQVSINCIFAFLIAVTLLVVGKGTISQSFLLNLLFYIIYTPILTTTLTKVMFMSENTMLVTDCIKRINSIFEIKPLSESTTNTKLNDNFIELKNIKFKYDNTEKNAIDDISMEIPANSTVALVGPSGSGKSTIANLIARFYDVNEGKILIGGIDIKDIKKEELMNTVSYVFQNSKLLKTSIYENVRMAKPNATKEEVMEALHLAQCDDIIEKLPNGINTIIGSKGTYLSGGEQQRINIARVMLKNSKIVILDEATAFADPENEYQVQKAFENLGKNKTVIMIAHRLSTIKNVDKIYVINNGKIEEQGTHEELINNNGIYNKMWNDYNTSIAWKVGEAKC